MNRRGILVLLVLLAITATLMAHRRVRQEARRTRARAEMMEVPMAIGIWRTMIPPMPESLDDLRRGRPLTPEAAACIDLGKDPWGHPYGLAIDGPVAYTVTCLGADGAPGGGGADEDIVLHWPSPKDTHPR